MRSASATSVAVLSFRESTIAWASSSMAFSSNVIIFLFLNDHFPANNDSMDRTTIFKIHHLRQRIIERFERCGIHVQQYHVRLFADLQAANTFRSVDRCRRHLLLPCAILLQGSASFHHQDFLILCRSTVMRMPSNRFELVPAGYTVGTNRN